MISNITSLIAYYRFGERLRERGFGEASDSRVICRWRHRETGLLLDVMPDDQDILGFENVWYAHTIKTATVRCLPSGTQIRVATPPNIIVSNVLLGL